MEPPYDAQVNCQGYTLNQTMMHSGNAPAYDYSPTHSWSFYRSYNSADCIPFEGDSVDFYQTPYAAPPIHPTSIPISQYSALRPSSTCDAFEPIPQNPAVFDDAPARVCKPSPVIQVNSSRIELAAPSQVPFTPPRSELNSDLNAEQRGTASYGECTAGQSLREDSVFAPGKGTGDLENRLIQRKAYFRAVSDNVGFTITDPDTITSHDKKRSYLESLEEYVQWLHEQIRLISQEPLPLERVATYRCFKSRSLRTILVHQQDVLHKLNLQKMQAEEKFMELQDAVLMRQAAKTRFFSSGTHA